MKITILLLALSIVMSSCVIAQSPFKKLPLLDYPKTLKLGTTVNQTDSIFNAGRFIAGTGYSYPDGNVQAGIGYGIQHLKYTYATQSYYCQWSASAYVFAGGNVAPKLISDVAKIAIMGGILNGAISAGPYYSIGPPRIDQNGKMLSKFGVMVITTINFNP